MANVKKEFNTKIYAVVAFVLVLAFLVGVCSITFKSKYNGFDPEKIAIAYTETIVNRGDGYNAYKNTLVSKNYKYGDYIREYYMYPLIYAESNYQAGMDISGLQGLNSESYMGEKTKNDEGNLDIEVADRMYPYYIQLMTELNGWDKYNTFYIKYFAKLLEVREQVFGDRYMTEEIMLWTLEANVSMYGDKLAGTAPVMDKNTTVLIEEAIPGIYHKKYGIFYSFSYSVTETKDITLEEYYEHVDEGTFKTYKISADDITAVKAITIKVEESDETVVEAWKVLVVKADGRWYVDNTNTNTATLYNFYQ